MNGACINEIIFCKKTCHLIVASHKGLFAWKLGNKVPEEDRYIYFPFFAFYIYCVVLQSILFNMEGKQICVF